MRTQADFSASACVALSQETGDVYIRDVIKMKEEWPEVRKAIISTARAESGVEVGVESALHGIAATQELHATTATRSYSTQPFTCAHGKSLKHPVHFLANLTGNFADRD